MDQEWLFGDRPESPVKINQKPIWAQSMTNDK